jgi:intracellular septation protein
MSKVGSASNLLYNSENLKRKIRAGIMKLLFDYLPILLFFIGYKLYGIYVATSIAILASFVQVTLYWIKHRRFESIHVITFVCVLIFGGATLLLHNEVYIKWKPTIIYWLLSLFFIGSSFIGKKTLLQRIMDNSMKLPNVIWQRLNLSWGIFFILLGGTNLFVIYHYSTNTWVNFKLFGTLGLTVAFIVLQSLYMVKYGEIKTDSKDVTKS